MSTTSMHDGDQRLLELLADRSTGDLDDRTLAELDRHLASLDSNAHAQAQAENAAFDDNSFDLAAAEIELAFHESAARTAAAEAMPSALTERLKALATDHVGSSDQASANAGSAAPVKVRKDPSSDDSAQPVGASAESAPLAPVVSIDRSASRPWPWLVAAAASILAVIAWWPTIPESGLTVRPLTTVGEERSTLLASAGDAQTLPWQATEDPSATGADGDVVWSASEQSGYMRIRGLKANDPSVDQYQLWVFDKTRDERHPVDGGVFDIPAGADEVIVPIDVRVPVGDAYLFAVTVEPPGGVVVSERERIVLVAQPA